MEWYVTKIVLQCLIDNKEGNFNLFDEQIRLLQANSNDEAYEKALTLGKSEERQYLNDEGLTVQWKFCGLFDLDILLQQQIHDGIEIYSERKRVNDKSELIVEKEKLSLFWWDKNKDKSAEKTLDDI